MTKVGARELISTSRLKVKFNQCKRQVVFHGHKIISWRRGRKRRCDTSKLPRDAVSGVQRGAKSEGAKVRREQGENLVTQISRDGVFSELKESME